MARIVSLALVLAFLLPSSFCRTTAAADDPFAWRWYELDKENRLRLNLYIFWRETCPHCPPALAFAEKLRARHPWLNLRRYELSRHPGNVTLYQKMAAKLGQPAGQTPAFLYCDQITLGFISEQQSGRQLEANLIRCYEYLQKQLEAKRAKAAEKPSPQESGWRGPEARSLKPEVAGFGVAASLRAPALAVLLALGQTAELAPVEDDAADLPVPQSDDAAGGPGDEILLDLDMPPLEEPQEASVQLPFLGEVTTSDWSLPALTLVIAGCDAFNPCAFFVLLSLMGLIIHARSRWRMALVGGTFVLCSGVFYFLMMAAWLNVFFLTGHLQAITVVAGVAALVVAVINIKDYFWFKRGVSLSIPEGAKPGLFDRMRRLSSASNLLPMMAGTLVLAAAANSYELLCTAGFPMVYTRVLTLRELPMSSYYGYLVLYNVIYILPLAAIVTAFTITLGRRKLQEQEGRVLKLLSGVMMLELGALLLIKSALLQNVGIAVALLVVAVVVTGLIAWMTRSRGKHAPSSASRERTSPQKPPTASTASSR